MKTTIHRIHTLDLHQTAFVVQWLRALILSHWILHRCGSSLARGTCEMPSSAPVGEIFSLSGYSGFWPALINARLDLSGIFLQGP